MKQNTLRGILVLVILLFVYAVVTFVMPFVHNAVFWLTVVFSLIAFGVLYGAWHAAGFNGENTRSKFYGFPILKIGFIYFAAQIIIGWIISGIGVVPVSVAIPVYAIGLAAAALGLIATDAVKEEIEKQDVKLKKDVSAMRALQSQVNQLASQAAGEAQKALQKFAEDLRYSDPVSCAMSHDAELELSALVSDLQNAVVEGDEASTLTLCRKAGAVLAERNRLCKLGKE